MICNMYISIIKTTFFNFYCQVCLMAHHCHCHSNCCKYKDMQEVCCLLQRYHPLLRAKHSRLIRIAFFENLKPAVKRAVAEATLNERHTSSSEDEESNEEDSSEEIATRKTATKNRVQRREREQVMKVAVIKRAEKGALMKFKSKRN